MIKRSSAYWSTPSDGPDAVVQRSRAGGSLLSGGSHRVPTMSIARVLSVETFDTAETVVLALGASKPATTRHVLPSVPRPGWAPVLPVRELR